MERNKNNTVGTAVGYVKKKQFIEQSHCVREYYAPQIEVNGDLRCISDKNTLSGNVECSTKNEALEKATKIRDRNYKILDGGKIMSIKTISLQHFETSKECKVIATTEDGKIHMSWLIENNKVLVFEYIPEDSPSGCYLIYDSEKEYEKKVKNIDWIKNNL